MNDERLPILIATGNAGKLAEFERLLGDEFRVEGLSGLDLVMPPEGMESYRKNAEAKAISVAKATARLTLGDDSGIEVRALGGAPGIESARFAGSPPSDVRNIEKLLKLLDGNGGGDRSARFVCWLALADADGLVTTVEGTCSGVIGAIPKGANGFGYDPVFLFDDGRSMAELSDQEKDLVSHRGNAVRAIKPDLERRIRGAGAHG